MNKTTSKSTSMLFVFTLIFMFFFATYSFSAEYRYGKFYLFENEIDKTADFTMVRIYFKTTQDVSDIWNVHPSGDENLLEEVNKRTSLKAAGHSFVLSLLRYDLMMKYPFVFIT